MHLIAKRQGRWGSESGPVLVYKIPDSDCMEKHSSAEHSAELFLIFESSFCCHPL